MKNFIGDSKTRKEDILINKASYFYLKHRYEESLKVFEQLEISSTKFDGIIRCLYKLGLFEIALENVNSYVIFTNYDPNSLFLLAKIQTKLKKPIFEQLENYLKSYKLDSNNEQVIIRLAKIYQNLVFPNIVLFLCRKISKSFLPTKIINKIQSMIKWALENSSIQQSLHFENPNLESLHISIFGSDYFNSNIDLNVDLHIDPMLM